jgi:hypothetical protein
MVKFIDLLLTTYRIEANAHAQGVLPRHVPVRGDAKLLVGYQAAGSEPFVHASIAMALYSGATPSLKGY